MPLDEARMQRMEGKLDDLGKEIAELRSTEAANAVRRQHVDDKLGAMASGLDALKLALASRDADHTQKLEELGKKLDELARPRRWTVPELGAAGAALTGFLYALGNTLSIMLGHGPALPPPPPPAPVEQALPKEGP